jgi:hypothetical protein
MPESTITTAKVREAADAVGQAAGAGQPHPDRAPRPLLSDVPCSGGRQAGRLRRFLSVTWARPGCCAIVTAVAEPRSSRPPSQRHAEHTELDPPPSGDRAH